ncbi:adenylate/guanylate cyclase domain-containing protein [Reyranella sp.]|uniref:CHASE2 domain-containing protein n=1 Tax=Reyranella sp. TaxID=1929291 RepID=UPI0025F51621|nr:adenylate/guanylate cyclase domain-containing protein [Reyranella sp.]
MSWFFGGAGVRRAPIIIALLVLINALFLRTVDPIFFSRMRDFAFDSFQRMQPREYSPDTPVRIVDIDEAALAAHGQWPWPRNVIAQLVEKLTKNGAAVVAFDVVFAESDRSSLSRMTTTLGGFGDAEAGRRLTAAQDNDATFAAAITRSRVVAGFGFDSKGSKDPPRRFFGVAFAGDNPSQFLPIQSGAVKSLPLLVAAAKGNGSVNTDHESVVIRRVPTMFRLIGQDGLFPALSIEALRVAQGASTYVIKSSGASSEMSFGQKTGIVALRIGDIQVPTDAQGRVALFDTGHREERFISARSVLADEVPAGELDGRIVFIGTSAIGLKDLRNTPVQDAVPGVEVHAQLTEQMIEQKFLARPDYADGAELLYLAAIGALFVWLLPRLSAIRMAGVAATFIAVGALAPWFAYSHFQLLLDPVFPPVTLAAIYVSGSVLAFMGAERDRREIRGAFSHYLSPDVVEQLARNPELLQLGGELREITVMFTDIRGFTTISEQFDPPGLTRFMNRFLTPMTDLILGDKGTIDKYMGDAIMAFWNAPLTVEDHAACAGRTALAMQARLRVLNEEWKAEAEREGRRHTHVAIGIGLNTGRASVGNFGSEQRFTYSCLGDEVNLASRLEGQCKTYSVDIIIGSNTAAQIGAFAMIELDLIIVKGKTEPECIHALIGDADFAKSPSYLTLVDRQASFLAAYRSGAFAEALESIDACQAAAEAAGWRQGYYAMMRERIGALIENVPPDWTGVYVAREK